MKLFEHPVEAQSNSHHQDSLALDDILEHQSFRQTVYNIEYGEGIGCHDNGAEAT